MRAQTVLTFLVAAAASWTPLEGAAPRPPVGGSLAPDPQGPDPAPDPGAPDPATTAPRDSDPSGDADEPADADRRLERLADELLARWAAAVASRQAAADLARERGLNPPSPVEPGLLPAFEDLSARGSGRATLWILEHFRAARSIPSGRVLEIEEHAARLALYRRSIRDHPDSVDLAGRRFDLLDRDRDLVLENVRDLCRLQTRISRVDEIRATALLVEARRTASAGHEDRAARARARALLEGIERSFPRTRAAHEAASARWRLEHLALGVRAPDFVTRDAAGNEIRLSDFRGQVVVVRFWGQRHAGGLRHLERAAQLEQRHWDERFTWIGVTDDPDREAFQRLCEDNDFTWTQAWEGGDQRPATQAWHLDRHPATYVLDYMGVVRGVDLEGPSLERMIDTLLGELHGELTGRERLSSAKVDGGDE